MLHPAVLLESSLGVEQHVAGATLVGAWIVSAIVSECRLFRHSIFNFFLASVNIAAPLASVMSQFFPGGCVDIHGFKVPFHHVFIPEFLSSCFATATAKFSIQEYFRDPIIFHSHNMSRPPHLRCSQSSLNTPQPGPPSHLHVGHIVIPLDFHYLSQMSLLYCLQLSDVAPV